MAIDSKHPDYLAHFLDWRQMRDTHDGQRAVKDRTTDYLPATGGQIEDGYPNKGTKGTKAYEAYLKRAVYPSCVEDSVETLMGAMHNKPPTIELPQRLEEMRDSCNADGESLEAMLRRINQEQLVTGRLGLWLDLPPKETPISQVVPVIALYHAERIINWDAGVANSEDDGFLRLVVLDETHHEIQEDFEWQEVERYRVLRIGESGAFEVAYFDKDGTMVGEVDNPRLGSTVLDEIPFLFVNASTITPSPMKPPLLRLSNLALSIYRGEADYRQTLYMSGQDTFVVIGDEQSENTPKRMGAGAIMHLPMGASGEYQGINSAGLPEQRMALESDRSRAESMGTQLLDAESRAAESGEALSIRLAAATAVLNQIALTGALALERLLRKAAVWVGADPNQVKIMPNMDFADEPVDPTFILEVLRAKQSGGTVPLSDEAIHAYFQAHDLTEFEFAEEMAKVREEAAARDTGEESTITEELANIARA